MGLRSSDEPTGASDGNEVWALMKRIREQDEELMRLRKLSSDNAISLSNAIAKYVEEIAKLRRVLAKTEADRDERLQKLSEIFEECGAESDKKITQLQLQVCRLLHGLIGGYGKEVRRINRALSELEGTPSPAERKRTP